MYVYIYISSSSSSFRAARMDIPNPLSLLLASGRSSGLHSVSSQTCCMYVRAGRPAFARPYVGSIGVHHLLPRPCFFSSALHVWFV